MRAKQTSFSCNGMQNLKASFGGSHLKSNPKSARPISTKDLMHIVLKSEQARGKHSFLHIERDLICLVQNLARKLNVRIQEVVVMGNHIHIALRVQQRRALKDYLRALLGLIVRKVLKVERNKTTNVANFFSGRPFSRIVAAGRRSFRALTEYFELNRLEKRGFSKAESRYYGLVDIRP